MNSTHTHAVFHSQLAEREAFAVSHPADINNLPWSQTGRSVLLAKGRAADHYPVTDGITDVLRVRPEIEMVRPDAGRVVAPMANEQPIGDWSVVQLPGNAVGQQHLPVIAADGDLPVALGQLMPSPYPARFRAMDLLPETLGQWARGWTPLLRAISDRLGMRHGSLLRVAIPRLLVAARGFLMPNFTTVSDQIRGGMCIGSARQTASYARIIEKYRVPA
jgi:hypothetical protein